MLKVIDDIAMSFDTLFSTILVLLDQSKPFNLVFFELIKIKLYWFRSGCYIEVSQLSAKSLAEGVNM